MTDDRLRIGDAEREAAAADLGEHFAQGRLSADEHAERLDRIWAARTRGELAPVFGDLPSRFAERSTSPQWTAPRPAQRSRARWWRAVPGPLLLVFAVLAGLTVITHFPLFLLGIGVFWLVAHRHRGWHHRHGWRY